ncbi:Expansin-B4 [Abeliophyllum distichum]|uniref:Expansin-B4 n=1 Tax=Abeliophyllum distichum TaxID=126358 RepID=A0ABD1RSB0_9LAMI
MFTHKIPQHIPLFTVLTILYFCCINAKSLNFSIDAPFSPAIATWYGSPEGAGSDGGACGFGSNVENAPYNSLISAGNENIYKSGKGCGTCYKVKCTKNVACSGNPVTVTITDECPECNYNQFDLSGKAFGSLAKPGQANTLRVAGKINIQYQRVPCSYGSTTIVFKIDQGSNPFYLAFAILFEEGDGDLASVALIPSKTKNLISMQQSFGATWKTQIPQGTSGPYSVRLTSVESRKSVLAPNVIPADWKPGQIYRSTVNFN